MRAAAYELVERLLGVSAHEVHKPQRRAHTNGAAATTASTPRKDRPAAGGAQRMGKRAKCGSGGVRGVGMEKKRRVSKE